MAEIELGPLSDSLDDDELKQLYRLLDQAGAKFKDDEDHPTQTIAKRLDEDAMTEFLDRLEAHDIAADIYLPVEFEGRLKAGDYRIASAQALADVLEEIQDELDVDDDDVDYDDGDDDDDMDAADGTVIEAQLRNIWRLASDAASEALEKKIPLHFRV